MTLAQLRSFVAVVRLGSVRAAAVELGVSEPAVSSAIGALRRQLGDELLSRSGRGLKITPGGRRLAARAVEILGLAAQAEREVAEARGEDAVVRVAASSRVAEEAAPPLLGALARRLPRTGFALSTEPAESFADLLSSRIVDLTLGPRPVGAPGAQWLPFLRHHMVVVAAPDHPLADQPDLPFDAVGGARWLTGPLGLEPLTTEGRWLARQRRWPADVTTFPTHGAALDAAAAGEGVAVAPTHRLRGELAAGRLAVLRLRGTPLTGFWYASVVDHRTASPGVLALLRFITTPDATQTMLSGRRDDHFRPPVHVTLWS